MRHLLPLVFVLSQLACFTTRVHSDHVSPGAEYSDRQWFTVGGLVRLSDGGGRECQDGLASVESGFSFTDWLLNVGITVAGGVAGAALCSNSSSADAVACASAGATLAPFILASRTTTYRCMDRPRHGVW